MITKMEQLTHDDLIILENTAINLVAANKSHTQHEHYTLYFWDFSDYTIPGVLLSDGNYYQFTAIELTNNNKLPDSVSTNIGAILTLDDTGYSILFLHNTLTECVYPIYPYPEAIDTSEPLINLHDAVYQVNLKTKMKEGI